MKRKWPGLFMTGQAQLIVTWSTDTEPELIRLICPFVFSFLFFSFTGIRNPSFLKTRNTLIWVKEIKTEQWSQSGHIPEPGPPLPRTGTPHYISGALTGSNDSETSHWPSSWQSCWVKAGATDEDHFPFYGPFPWSEAPKVYIHDASEGLHSFIFKQGMKLTN